LSAPTILSPVDGAIVAGTVTVTGAASSITVNVDVSVDGGGHQTASGTTSWWKALDTTALADGAHTLTARATDSRGRTATTAIVINVSNAVEDRTYPTILFAGPLPQADISGAIAVHGTAADDVQLAKVEVGVDLSPFADATGTATWTYALDAGTLAIGPHTLTARATDTSGKTSQTAITVNVVGALPPAPSLPPPPPLPTLFLWSALHERGTLADWYFPAATESKSLPHGGGEYNSGVGDSVGSTEVAHSGSWSAKQTIDTSSGSSGTRLFRWEEFRSLARGEGVYASAWFFVPQPVKVGGYLNVFQLKSKTQDERYIDVFFQLNVFSRSDGSLYLKPGWGWGAENPAFPGGPYRGGPAAGSWFAPSGGVNVPVGKWFEVTAYIVPSAGYDGVMKFWQDGVLIGDFENVMTGYPNTNSENGVDTQWSVNAYGNGLTPSVYSHYVDDADISNTGP
jgi:hypothetical protein